MKNPPPSEPARMSPEQFHAKFPDVDINTDCARDYACPSCGGRGPFRVEVTDFVDLSDENGYSFPSELAETDTPPRCLDCDYKGADIILPGLDEYLERLANERSPH